MSIPVEGYIEYETDYPLPAGINGGWWKFENGQPVEYPELKPETELEQRIADLETAIATDNAYVYIGGETQTVRVIENRDLIKIIRRYQ